MSSPPKILAVLPHVIPSTTINVIKPLAALHHQKQIVADITLEYLVSRSQVERADVIVFCRNIEPGYKNVLTVATELGKPIIYDLDDNLFALPSGSTLGDSRPSPEQMNQLVDYLKSASLVRVYSETLGRRVAQINPSTALVDGPLDWSLIPPQSFRREPREKVKIVYATSRIGDELANIFLEDVEQLLVAYSGRVELFLWGVRSDRLAHYPSVRFLKHITNYDRYFRKFADYGFDIGLAPLLNDEFHLSKTNIKFREYAACRIAGVYSNVRVYSDCVKHGETGLLVANQKGAWFEAMARLVEDAALRKRIQEQACQYARQHYNQEKFCAVWLEQIRAVLAKKSAAQTVLVERDSLEGQNGLARMIQSVERLSGLFGKVAAHLARRTWRFIRSIKRRGVRQTFDIARWTLNDLSILFWNRSEYG